MLRSDVPAAVPVMFIFASKVRAVAVSPIDAPYCSPTTDAIFIACVICSTLV